MNKDWYSSVKEYMVTGLVTATVLFSVCLFIQLQLYFNIETIINERELQMKNLAKFYNIDQLEAMKEAQPNNYMILINLAKSYEAIEQYKDADKLYKEALLLSKHSDYVLYSYALFCAKMGWYSIACDIAEEFDFSKKKTAYRYRAEIYYELAKNFDKNKEYQASIKAYQVAYKYAKNINNSKFFKRLASDYAKEFVKLADSYIEEKNVDDAILALKNSLSIKELDITKYKLGLIYKDVDMVSSEKYFHEVFKSNLYLVNPYIYNDILSKLINEAKNSGALSEADFYSVRLDNLKRRMKEYYIYKGDILFDKAYIATEKKLFKNRKKHFLCFSLKNNTKNSINNLFVKVELVVNNNTYELEKKIVTSSSPLGYYEELKDIELELPSGIEIQNNKKMAKKNQLIAKYYVRKQKKAPWTLAKIEVINF